MRRISKAYKTEDGVRYGPEHYLVVPDPDKPSTWKLRIAENVNGRNQITRAQLGRATAALGAGFRGERVQLSAEERRKAIARLRSLYRQLGVEEEEFPEVLTKVYRLEIDELGVSVEKEYVEKPYPNEHSCRIKSPADFQGDSFRRIQSGNLSMIIGKLKGEDKTTVQAFRYPIETWSEDKAHKHCVEQGGTFEPSSNKMEKFQSIQSKYEAISYIADEDFEIDGIKIKKGQELRYVLGVVLEPDTIDATRTDETIGDVYNEEEVRKAAHYFLANYKGKGNDFMHDGKDRENLKIVESYIAPVEMELNGQKVKKGSWLMATLVLDDVIWEKIKKGEITGYSIGGRSNAKIEVTETV